MHSQQSRGVIGQVGHAYGFEQLRQACHEVARQVFEADQVEVELGQCSELALRGLVVSVDQRSLEPLQGSELRVDRVARLDHGGDHRAEVCIQFSTEPRVYDGDLFGIRCDLGVVEVRRISRKSLVCGDHVARERRDDADGGPDHRGYPADGGHGQRLPQ